MTLKSKVTTEKPTGKEPTSGTMSDETSPGSTSKEQEQSVTTVLDWDLPEESAHTAGLYLGEVFPDGFQLIDGTTLDLPEGRPETGRSIWRIYLSSTDTAHGHRRLKKLANTLHQQKIIPEPGKIRVGKVPERDWWEATKERFPILSIGPFTFVPPWRLEEVDTAQGPETEDGKEFRHRIELEPGEAFGTGHHPTTRLCLHAMSDLEQNGFSPASVLDLGCGSGILALAAASLWPAVVVATDVEDAALELTRKNAGRNEMEERVITLPTHDILNRSFDLVLANIRYDTLLELTKHFPNWVRPGGTAVLSGILEQEVASFLSAWRTRAPGFTVTEHTTETDRPEDEQPSPGDMDDTSKSAASPTTPSRPPDADTWACLILRRESSTAQAAEPSRPATPRAHSQDGDDNPDRT
jgi:ribosomal protein L11 methyltransferase